MNSEKKYKQPKMVNWYDAQQLASTGLRSVISGQFGRYADKRELQAAIRSNIKAVDFSSETEIWIDYVSDTGDGFNSTFSVARLISEQKLNLALKNNDSGTNSVETQAGKIIIFGGDEVYPTPEMNAYENRFKIPFASANPFNPNTPENERPKMFAIPGNHDWYDGLSNFIALFCQKRWIGNWQTIQERSYFAIKLPYNYWIFGTDVQLDSDIDQPQKEYFQHIAINEMQDGDKVILCTAEPAWVYYQMYNENESYKRLKYFEKLYITDDTYKLTGKKFKLVATLTGDLHHYSRYEEQKNGYINHLITAGGGGAFLHPTHLLPEKLTKQTTAKFTFLENKSTAIPELKATFPDQKDSQNLSWLNFAFPWLNKQFVLFLAVIEVLLCWILQGTNFPDVAGSFMGRLAKTQDFSESFWFIFKTMSHNPLFILISAVLVFGCMVFTDTKRIRRLNLLLGLPHGLLQWLNMMFWIIIFARLFHNYIPEIHTSFFVLFTSFSASIAAGISGALIFGIYLWFAIYFLKVHLDEGFSSLGWQHYKNFLRIHITKDQLTIYPVGVDRVTTNWAQSGEGEKLKFSGKLPDCHLIEPPIIIKNNKI